MTTSTPLLRVENLTKVFGDHTQEVKDLVAGGAGNSEIKEQTGSGAGVIEASFEVQQGEIFVLMGLSGSGKSTLLRLLNRLIEPTAGSIRMREQDITQMDTAALQALRRQKMSMVFQSFALLPHLSVEANVAFGLEVAGVERQQRLRQARLTLESVGLAEYASNAIGDLSGGMQQRVGLARALANRPEILLMDEAFSALDPLIRRSMQDELLALQEREQRTIVFVSHDLEEAVRIGDRIAIMKDGRIVQIGTPRELYNQPADDYVAGFFAQLDPLSVLNAAMLAQPEIQDVQDSWPTIPWDTMGSQVIESLHHHGCPLRVLDGAGELLGTIGPMDVMAALSKARGGG